MLYGGNVAIDRVSIEAPSGMVTAILGSNGAGKTTILKAVCGLVKPASGTVSANGKMLSGLDTAKIVGHGVCLVPEGRELFPRMTVKENLLVGAYLRSDRQGIRKDIESVFSSFPVLERKSHLAARSLSGGEQQMLAFGRALLASPSILLLDEPSVGLAPLIEQQLMGAIRQLATERQLTVVLVEQNANLALSIADHAYVLETGRTVISGTARAVQADERVKKAYLGG